MIVENIWDWYWWYDHLQLYVVISITANAVCIAQRLISPAKVTAATRCKMLVSLDWLENELIVSHSWHFTSIVILKLAQKVLYILF